MEDIDLTMLARSAYRAILRSVETAEAEEPETVKEVVPMARAPCSGSWAENGLVTPSAWPTPGTRPQPRSSRASGSWKSARCRAPARPTSM